MKVSLFGSIDLGALRLGALRVAGSLAALGLLLGASGTSDRPEGNFSNEMTGTLPGTGGGGPFIPDRAQLDTHRAGFYVEGRWQAVVQAALQASGPGHVTFEVMSGQAELRAVFHGDLRIALHDDAFRNAFRTGGLQAGLLLGGEGGPVAVGLIHGERMVTKVAHDASLELPLPMQHLQDSGALVDGVTLITWSPSVGRGIVRLGESPGMLHIAQSF